MRRLLPTTPARRDLVAINRCLLLASGQPVAARAFTHRRRDRCQELAALPGTLGTAYPELGAEIRAVTEHDCLILFRYEPGILRVLRFIKGHHETEHTLRSGEH